MASGSTCSESINKEECHQGSAGARFYAWKVVLLRARRMFLWTLVVPFCIHATIATNTTYFDCFFSSIPRALIADLDIPNLCIKKKQMTNPSTSQKLSHSRVVVSFAELGSLGNSKFSITQFVSHIL